MANPICLSPLKFYDSLAKQSHRKSYAYNHITPIITKKQWIPSFQFVIPKQLYANGGELAEFKIFNAKTNAFVANVDSQQQVSFNSSTGKLLQRSNEGSGPGSVMVVHLMLIEFGCLI